MNQLGEHKTMKRLIITADDMGYNEERNRGIVECFLNKGITNSSLMVNGVASHDAAKLALKNGLPTGLHFNIIEGVPVELGSKYKTLTDSQGHFLQRRILMKAAAEGKIDTQEVKEELTRQIARYVELIGSKPVYVDGHQHAHIIPELAETFAKTLAEHGILATRLPYEHNLESVTWVEEPLMTMFHTVCNHAELVRPILRAHNIWASDAFYGLGTMGKNMTAKRLQDGIKSTFDSLGKDIDKDQPVTCELMTHPGFACKGPGGCGDGPDDFSKSPDREYEKSILESEEMKDFYKQNNITIMPYDQCVEVL